MQTQLRLFAVSLLLIPFLPVCAFAQKSFVRTYNGFESVQHLVIGNSTDSGLVMAISKYDDSTIVVARYDKCDELKWNIVLKHRFHMINLKSAAITSEGDVLIAGSTFNFSIDTAFSIFLIKLNQKGDLIFGKNYFPEDLWDATSYDNYSVVQLPDGNYLIHGSMQFWTLSGGPHVLVVDPSSGSIIRSKRYLSIALSDANGNLIPTSDSGIVVGSERYFFKLNKNFEILWGFRCFGPHAERSNPIEVSGGYVLSRHFDESGDDLPTQLFKIDFNGKLLWAGEGMLYNVNHELTELDNGDFLAVGGLEIERSGMPSTTTLFTLLNNAGNIKGQWILSQDSVNHHSTICGRDGNIYQAGYTEQGTPVICRQDQAEMSSGCNLLPYVSRAEKLEIELMPWLINSNDIPMTMSDMSLHHYTEQLEYLQHNTCEPVLDVGNDSLLCPGEEVTVLSNLLFNHYQWSTGDTLPYITISSPGIYVLEASDQCLTLKDTVTIEYHPASNVKYEVGPLIVSPFEAVHFSVSPDAGSKIVWLYDGQVNTSGSFDHYFNENGTYPVIYQITDTFGCLYSDTMEVIVDLHSFYVPKAFTADGDGLNDVFKPIGHGIGNYQMEIYNRWGEKLYSEKNGGWDGTFNGKYLPSAVYVYEIRLADPNGTEIVKRGLVTLIQ